MIDFNLLDKCFAVGIISLLKRIGDDEEEYSAAQQQRGRATAESPSGGWRRKRASEPVSKKGFGQVETFGEDGLSVKKGGTAGPDSSL